VHDTCREWTVFGAEPFQPPCECESGANPGGLVDRFVNVLASVNSAMRRARASSTATQPAGRAGRVRSGRTPRAGGRVRDGVGAGQRPGAFAQPLKPSQRNDTRLDDWINTTRGYLVDPEAVDNEGTVRGGRSSSGCLIN
jgi:hypothetical protein